MPRHDYDKMTSEDFDRHLLMVMSRMTMEQVLAIPGVYEVLSEELNNEVLDSWAKGGDHGCAMEIITRLQSDLATMTKRAEAAEALVDDGALMAAWQSGYQDGKDTGKAERDRYREALEFYADEQSWNGPQSYPRTPWTDDDKGKRARAALQSTNQKE